MTTFYLLLKKTTLICLTSFIISVVLLLLLYFQHKILLGVNADQLQFPLFLKTIFLQGFSYHSWYLTTGLYFFPDNFFVLLSLIVTRWNIYFATAFELVIQLLLLYSSLIWFAKIFIDLNKSLIIATFVTLLIVNIAIIKNSYFIPELIYGSHAGLLIITLVILGIFVRDINNTKAKPSRILIVVLLTILCTASDSLYLAWCIIPLLLTLSYLLSCSIITFNKYILWIFWLVLSALTGLILRLIIAPNPLTFHPYFSFSAISINLFTLYQAFFNVNVTDKILMIISMICMIYLIVIFLYKVFTFQKIKNYPQSDSKIFTLSFCFFLFGFLTASNLLFSPGKPILAYIFILFVLPITVVLVLDFSKYHAFHAQYRNFAYIVSIIVFVSFLVLKVFAPWQNIRTSYTPPHFQCIYKALAKYKVNYGIAGYWDAKPLIGFSKGQQLCIATFIQPLNEFLWSTSSEWYHPSYDFAVFRAYPPDPRTVFNKQLLFRINGIPKHYITCGNYQILIYGKKKLYTSFMQLLSHRSTTTIPASVLLTQIGIKKGDAWIVSNNKKMSGFLTYGPYINIPNGKYLITLSYKANNLDLINPSWFDVSYQHGTKELYHKILPNTDNKLKNLSTETIINTPIDSQFEFRVYYSGKGDLSVLNVQIRKQS